MVKRRPNRVILFVVIVGVDSRVLRGSIISRSLKKNRFVTIMNTRKQVRKAEGLECSFIGLEDVGEKV